MKMRKPAQFQDAGRRLNMLRRCSRCFVALLVITPAAWVAKPKPQVFDAPPDRVFQAALKAAREHYTIKYADEKNLYLTFHAIPTFTYPAYECTASVEPAGEGKSKLTLNVQYETFVVGDHTANPAKKFFGYVSENLTKQPAN